MFPANFAMPESRLNRAKLGRERDQHLKLPHLSGPG
jgi:hypothetical protein